MADQGKLISINVDQLELDLTNPRHKHFKRPSQAIEYLVLKERVIELATDISKEGTNPMDLLGVFQKKGTGDRPAYIAAEGNRRVCALMLLHDPEKIPSGVSGRAKMVQKLEAAAKSAQMPSIINVVLFKSKKAAKPWVDRMHIQDGRSRRRWSPDQQERAMGGGRNQDAAALLDAALTRSMISEADRESKLTTVQRYLGNPTMRKALGIVRDNDRIYWVDRQLSDFSLLLDAFLEDVRTATLSSRSNAADVIRYSDQILAQTGVSNDRVKPIGLADALDEIVKLRSDEGGDTDHDEKTDQDQDQDQDNGEDQEGDQKQRRSGNKFRQKIGGTYELQAEFEKSGCQKLQSLYESITDLSLRKHCPLITVGFWSLMESLAALHGGEGSTFDGYFHHNRLNNDFGITNKEQRKTIVASLKRLTEKGNSTKHSAVAASFDGQQIANDFDVLTPLILSVLRNLPK
ncbi:hypothetical protein [Tritonibacter mobilis]|uniref:hypothetical protein n=1 Tax=Tritonibacter mobilis TaxID=379347 RepID=UPI000806B9F7|nr:hypothetical protein [Tritonibacter mobilis]